MDPHMRSTPKREKASESYTSSQDNLTLWYYKVGQQVNLYKPGDQRIYGSSQMPTLSETLGKPTSYVDRLWKARFLNSYERSEVRSLCKSNSKTSFIISWPRILHLLSLEADDRVRFQEQCLTQEWSSKELHRRIKDFRDPACHGGRRLQKPKSMEAALRQLTRESQMWHRRYHEIWFRDDDPAIDLEGRKRLPKSTRELLDEAVDTLQSLRHDIEQSLAVFDAVQQVKKKPVRKR